MNPQQIPIDRCHLMALQEQARLMLDFINQDRQAKRLSPLAWDETAASAGARHADEMANQDFFSHWNSQGFGPDLRYTQAGGRDAVSENIYTFYNRYSNGQPAPIQDWRKVIEDAQASLMVSPGHRRTILTPTHTHVGVGLAYRPNSGQIWLAQEFVARYVRVASLPTRAPLGTTVVVQGELLADASEPLVNLAFAPRPAPMSVATLNRTGAYRSPAKIFAPIQPELDASGRFHCQATFDHRGQAGFYHVRVWVKVSGQRANVLASEVVIEVT